jgi:hypothetical protein
LNLPEDSYKWNKAMLGSFKKGILAHQEGKKLSDCPYKDKRVDSGRLSWSRSFIRAWQDGFRWSEDGKA